jgi:hypothetical protein
VSNIFRNTTETYYQVPDRLMTDGTLRPSSISLYLTILKQAQKKSSTIVLFKTSAILKMIDIAPRHFQTAREQLQKYNLVKSAEVKRGLWLFELLSLHGVGLDNSIIGLDKLSKEKVESYFLPHLKDYDFLLREDGNLVSRCPFHIGYKPKERSFHLKLVDDGMGIGVWNCFACEKAGGIIDFEMQRTKTWGKREQALNQVLNFFRRQREGDPQAPIEPILPVPQYIREVEDEPQAI